VDPDTGDTHTYSLVTGDGDHDNAAFTISGDQLLTAEIFNYETKSSYTIRVRSTDSGTPGLYLEEVFIITILDVNDAPVALNQTIHTEMNVPITITLLGSDEDENSLDWYVGDPSFGSLTGSGANRTYTPNLDYHGPDSFTFFVYDGELYSLTATITIYVEEPEIRYIYLPIIINSP
jgi:hypothetical protein